MSIGLSLGVQLRNYALGSEEIAPSGDTITTEDGDAITTEDGDPITTE